jgi:transcription initiation factor TFIID/TFIIF subunit
MRKWSVKIVAVGPAGQELPATFIEKAVYNLHPSFTKPVRCTPLEPLLSESLGECI